MIEIEFFTRSGKWELNKFSRDQESGVDKNPPTPQALLYSLMCCKSRRKIRQFYDDSTANAEHFSQISVRN